MSVKRDRGRIAERRKPAPDPGARSNRETLAIGGILLVTLLTYLRCLGNGFVFDDRYMIVDNRYIGRWSFLWRSFVNDSWWFRDPYHLPASTYYRPFQDVWFALNYHLFGFDWVWWHAAIVGLHLIAVCLVFKIAARMTADRWGAALAGALFALLPIHAEAVVWISAIPLPLSATLELAAFYLLITRAGAARRNWAPALIFYGAALFTHESAVAFPALVWTWVFLCERAEAAAPGPSSAAIRRRIRDALAVTAPFAIELTVYLIARRRVLGFINWPNPQNPATDAQVLMTVPIAIVTYLELLVAPWKESPAHRLRLVKSMAAPGFYLPALGLLGLGCAFWLMLRRDPRRRLYLFCAAWLLIAIGPMMNLRGFSPGALIQDRYLYLASVGWCVMVADWAVRLARRSAAARGLVWSVALVAMPAYAAVLWNVQGFWRDDITWSRHCIEKVPDSAFCHRQFASVLKQLGDPAAAEREFKTAASLDPDDPSTLVELAKTEAMLGRIAEAVPEMAAGLERMRQPEPGDYGVLAELYDLNGQPAQSEAALKRAESLPGGLKAVGMARAQIKMLHADNTGAEAILRGLIARYPDDFELWRQLGAALADQKRYDEALAGYRRAAELKPDDPALHFFIAKLLHDTGRDRQALGQCRAALAVDPNDADTQALMAEIVRSLKGR